MGKNSNPRSQFNMMFIIEFDTLIGAKSLKENNKASDEWWLLGFKQGT